MASFVDGSEEDLVVEEDRDAQEAREVLSRNHSTSWKHQSCLPFRLFRVLLNDPAAFLFVLSLFIVSLCMPFLGLYLKSSDNLLDLDSMKVWNKFIGRLYQKHFSVSDDPFNPSLATAVTASLLSSEGGVCNEDCGVVGVKLNFDVSRNVFKKLNISTLVGNFSGRDMNTVIKDVSNKRVDSMVNLHIMIDVSKDRDECIHKGKCTIKGCVLITAPKNASRFSELLQSSIDQTTPQPPETSICSESDVKNYYKNFSQVRTLSLSPYKSLVKTSGTQVRKHGLILIYISEEDQQLAARRIYKISIVFLGLALAFLIGLSCTTTTGPGNITGSSNEHELEEETVQNSYHID